MNKIHIKKENRGKFGASAKRAGMGTQEYARHILANKDDYSPIQVKRAAFAKGIGGSQIKKHKHENGGVLKAQEGTNELYPAGITIPSSETIDFFKDFTQRYKKLNHIDKSQLIQDLISKDKAIVSNKGLPKYNTDTKQIFIPSDDVGVSTYSHELVHKLNDLVLERTNKERKLLNDAYPLSIAKHVYGRAPEDMRNELIEDERFSTNTELRRKISSDYGNVLGKKLNKVIKSLSTNDIINYVNNINGYVGESDFLKYPEHIIDGKTLFEHWKEDIGDVPEYYNMPWEELPKSEQNQWQYLYDSREGVAPNYMVFDEDKPKAIKKALIKVAQESKSNDIRSKNLINVSRQGGILKAQEGTGNLLTPRPLSPLDIAMKHAKAMAKMKEEQPQHPQQHLPPGVKEVVGPDGKKVVIRTEQPLVPLEQSIAEWLPGTGDVAEVGYIANDVKNGNYGSAALAAVLMTLPGNAGKLLNKYRFNKAVKKFNSTIDNTANTEHFDLLMDLSRSDEFVQQNLFQDPTDVKTIIHGDGAASGFNDPKKLTTVGHRGLTSLEQLPHFRGDRIVPANTEISQPGGRAISAKEHPLFLSDTQPWYETAHNGETLKRYWGIDGENSTGLWEWIDKKGKMHIPTESPYRFITVNIDDLPDIKPGKFTGRRGSSEYESLEGIPLSKIKSAFEYDPVLKVWSRVIYKQ